MITGKKLIAASQADLQQVAQKILFEKQEEKIFALFGKMGAGKTTLIKAFCKVLGVGEVVGSPTFSLVNEYTTNKMKSIYYFDFYRIRKLEEVFDIGYEEYFYSGNYCFVEWPELILSLLPPQFVRIDIDVKDNEVREIAFQTVSH